MIMAIDRIILGKDCAYPADPELSGGLNANVIVLGGSGSGKTQSIVVPRGV